MTTYIAEIEMTCDLTEKEFKDWLNKMLSQIESKPKTSKVKFVKTKTTNHILYKK